jgi:hypothetical protein
MLFSNVYHHDKIKILLSILLNNKKALKKKDEIRPKKKKEEEDNNAFLIQIQPCHNPLLFTINKRWQ